MLLGVVARSQVVVQVAGMICGFGPGVRGRSLAVGLCAGQPATELGTHPSELSGVGAQPGFQLWEPSPLMWVHASRVSGECWGCLFAFTVQGLTGEGCLRPLAAAESSLISC